MNKKIIQYISIITWFLWLPNLNAQKICTADQSIQNQQKKYLSLARLHTYQQEPIRFSWPIKICQCWISSLYGKRGKDFHHGIDLAALKGTPVYAAADGSVITAIKDSALNSYGNMVMIEHVKNKHYHYKTRYAHLDSIETKIYNTLKSGKKYYIKQGEKIGTVGSTGHVKSTSSKNDPSHLHFEIYKNNQRIDPLLYLFASKYKTS